MKRLHADLIHAYADGAEIEYFDEHSKQWYYVQNPSFMETTKYRIKLEPWQQELVDAISRVEVNYGNGWVESTYLQEFMERYSIHKYDWMPKECYRLKPEQLHLYCYKDQGQWKLHSTLLTEEQAKNLFKTEYHSLIDKKN